MTKIAAKSEDAGPRLKVREPLRLRFALLWGVLLLVFGASFFLLRYLEGFEYHEALSHERESKVQVLGHLIELKGASLRQFADDYSQWDEMVEFARSPSTEWAKVNIDASLRNFQACAAWVHGKEGEELYSVVLSGTPPRVEAAQLTKYFSKETKRPFFVFLEGQLYEYRVSQLFSSADVERRGPSYGWFVVARLWSPAYFESIGLLTQSKPSFVNSTVEPVLHDADGQYQMSYALYGITGKVLGWLLLDCGSPDIVISLEHDGVQMLVFLVFVMLTVGVVFFGLQLWVFQPLKLIDQSLSSGHAVELEPLEKDKSELGHLAALVRESFEQRRALREEVQARREAEAALLAAIEERSEFARNLHDGAIQTLYAAGMGVGGALPIIAKDPEEAKRRIEQSRMMLNEVIRELRGFIVGLEPEPPSGDFTEIIERMAKHMQGLRSFTPKVLIETLAEEDLSPEERVQLLYVAREALSNALRHGQASEVAIELRREGTRIVFQVSDNGSGLSEQPSTGSGQGLQNIRLRALELGAEFEICSAVPHGLVVKISIQTSDTP